MSQAQLKETTTKSFKENPHMDINTALKADENYAYIPEPEITYAPYGNFFNIRKVIKSNKFFPIWVTGLAGTGKTQMIEQACATASLPEEFFDLENKSPKERFGIIEATKTKGREFIRVNFTTETDESDLIGSWRLHNGNMIFHKGPVTVALERGAILLLDEVDAGHTNKILCLQSVMEGRGVLIKATGEFVKPAPGFNIFATSNTKGRGSEDGKFLGTNIMNGAFLDRFAGVIEQSYPPMNVESFILQLHYMNLNFTDPNRKSVTEDEKMNMVKLCKSLTEWADQIRKTHEAGAIDEVISTRSLLNIVSGISIIGLEDSIALACQRYDEATSSSFIDIYEKKNAGVKINKKS